MMAAGCGFEENAPVWRHAAQISFPAYPARPSRACKRAYLWAGRRKRSGQAAARRVCDSAPAPVMCFHCSGREKAGGLQAKYGGMHRSCCSRITVFFIAADTRKEIDTLMDRWNACAVEAHAGFLGASPATERAGALKTRTLPRFIPRRKSNLLCNKEILSFVSSRHAFAPLSAAFTPDHIVYCKAEFLSRNPGLMDVKFQEFMDKRDMRPR